MNSDVKDSSTSYSRRLSQLEEQLRQTMDDSALQQEMFTAIRELVTTRKESEADIRRVLIEQFRAGRIRKDTLKVVQGMLDRITSEQVKTMPDGEDPVDGEDRFSGTDVLPSEAVRHGDETEQLQAGTILRDRFLLQKKVAGGSMGVVFKALDRRLAEVDGIAPWVAIKVLTPLLSRNANALRAIQQEAAKGRCLSHPNIVRFIDLDRDEDLYFLVMEWLDGRSLASVLDDPESKTLDQQQVFDIVRQLANALDYAHRCGVVHADVKPGNVMLMDDGQVKLIDFGVARIRQQSEDHGSQFDPGVLGAATPAYSSMQVLTGEDPVPADDVFSLACLTYRLLAGYRVFGPRNAAEAAEEGMSPQKPDQLSDARWRALRKALSFSRVTRYATPREFADEFIAAADEVPMVAVRSDDAVVTPRAESRRSSWPWVAFAAVATVAAITWILREDLATLPFRAMLDRFTNSFPGVVAGSTDSAEGDSAVPVGGSGPGNARQPGTAIEPRTNDVAETGIAGTGAEPGVTVADAPALPEALPDTVAEPAPETGGDDGPAAATESGRQAVSDVSPVPAAPAATYELQLGRIDAGGLVTLPVRLREDGEPATIDLLRPSGVDGDLDLVVEEIRFAGNRSAWETGQYVLSDNGQLRIPADLSTVRLEIAMTSDPLREADREVGLAVKDAASGQELGLIDLQLEDDDQRRFEAALPVNAVGFAVSQVSVAEADSAAQIDVVRYRPDDSSLSVSFEFQEVTARRDADFFVVGPNTIEFAPGQRTARILVPLVQDAEVEDDEAFFIELTSPDAGTGRDIFRRVAVMIRDDDG